MKKISKVLCLVLVLAMMAGLCCFGTSADYADADKITYKEAVDVLSAVKVLQGDDNGFRPLDGLTRAEACKIITCLVGADDIAPTASTFSDTKGHWAERYIAYCAAEGFVNGVGDNKFDPEGKLTGSAFAKMVLCAVGFNAEAEGMTGADWEIAVAKLVKAVALARGIVGFDGTKAITREEAAQLAFVGGMFVQLRDYTSGMSIAGTNLSINVGGSYDLSWKCNDGRNVTIVSRAEGNVPASELNPQIYTLLEKVFNVTARYDGAFGADDFNRPAGTYFRPENKALKQDMIAIKSVTKPTKVYTAATPAATIAADLAGYSVVYQNGEDTFSYPINNATNVLIPRLEGSVWINSTGYDLEDIYAGLLNSINSPYMPIAAVIAALTKNGRVVEIYADNNQIVYGIVIIDYAFGTVVTKNVKATPTCGAYTEYTVKDSAGNTIPTLHGRVYTSHVVAAQELDTVVGTAAAGDKVTATITDNGKLYLYPVTEVTGKVTSINNLGVATIDGTKYSKSYALGADTVPVNAKADNTIYLDQYGYMLGSKAAAPAQTAFMLTSATTYTQNANGTLSQGYTATLVFPDGTVSTVASEDLTGKPVDPATLANGQDVQSIYGTTPNVSGANGACGLVKYVQNANGAYVLSGVAYGPTMVVVEGITKNDNMLKCNNVFAGLYANASTLFVYANRTPGTVSTATDNLALIDGTVNTVTGIANVKTDGNVEAVAVDTDVIPDGVANVVFVFTDSSGTTTTPYVFVTGTYTNTGLGIAYDVIVDGVADTIVLPATAAPIAKGLYQTLVTNGTGVTDGTETATSLDAPGAKIVGGLLYGAAEGGQYVVMEVPKSTDGTVVAVAADCKMFEINWALGTMEAVEDPSEPLTGIVFARLNETETAIAAVYVITGRPQT